MCSDTKRVHPYIQLGINSVRITTLLVNWQATAEEYRFIVILPHHDVRGLAVTSTLTNE